MNIASVLQAERVWCQAPGGSKKRVLENLAEFAARSLPTLDAGTVLAQLIARERLGSTGLGQGIAIPHCRLPDITQAIGILASLEAPVDFDAPDDQPVDLLFVLMVPAEATEAHLQLLGELATRFSDPAWCQRLRGADSAEALFRAALEST